MNKTIEELIELAIKEDIPNLDQSSELLIDDNDLSMAYMIMKEEGIISGIEIGKYILNKFKIEDYEFLVNDGDVVKNKQIICEIKGRTKTILLVERLMLNIIQRMSGIATKTNLFVKEVTSITKILDTRKTTPNFRLFEKLAVTHGGGVNHRFSLSDMVMLKDNHLKAFNGNIIEAVDVVKSKSDLKVEVEVETIEMFEEALKSKADRIMLDNMNLELMKKCVLLNNEQLNKKELEASGNMTIDRIKDVSDLCVDFISVGELTHSIKSLDISMKFK